MRCSLACLDSGHVGPGRSAASTALPRPPHISAARPLHQRRHRVLLGTMCSSSNRRVTAAAAAAELTADDDSSSSGISSSQSTSGAGAPTPRQEAAADRLLQLSREASQHRNQNYMTHSDAELRQRVIYVLQMGFSEAAITKHIKRQGGGPYVAVATVGEMVVLLQREGFSQKQRDSHLAGGGVFTRQPADVEAVLRWLRQTFGLMGAGLAQACGNSPTLLCLKQEALEANWRAIVAAYTPTEQAMTGLAHALRHGNATFLYYKSETIRQKVAALQEMLGLSDAEVPARFGVLAGLFGYDIESLKPRFTLLLDLTGLPNATLVSRIQYHLGLLRYQEETLQRNYCAIEAAVGDAAATKLLVSRYPVVLAGEDRVWLNLQTLQRMGASPAAAVKVLVSNGRLAGLDLERPAFAARVEYCQQAYGLATAEAAMLQCYNILHRSLRTVAPRVEFWRDQRPGQPLPSCSIFTVGDATFCRRQRLPLADFLAFKQQWAASPEGQKVCRHEGPGKARGGGLAC